jgi:primosomal protein N' (replication factor Y)
MALLRAEANNYRIVDEFLQQAAETARMILRQRANDKVVVYDAVRPQMERLKGMERGHLLLQADSRQAMQSLIRNWVAQLRVHPIGSKLRWALDVDPLEF